MCTDEQHREKMAALDRNADLLRKIISGRRVIDQTYTVSDTQGFILDYKGRKHLYIYSVNAIVIDLKSLGTLNVSAKTWTAFDYEEGLNVFTSGTASPVSVLVRATDEVIASANVASGGGGGGGAITAASGSYASGAMVDGAIVTLGATGDTASTNSASTNSAMSFFKGLVKVWADVWDSVNHRIKVDGSTVTQPVSGTFWQATQPVSGTFWQATQPVSGTLTANQGGTWTVQSGNTANTTPWLTSPQSATSGGSTPFHAISAASTNGTNVKSSAGQIYGISISNTNASARFFKLYDKATSPTVGTDTPKRTIQVPGNSIVVQAFPVGLAFTSGIAFAATASMADSDTSVIGAGDLSMDLDYK